jgi:predicted glycoside hydrolase/deacetylase ChbG (UPF0249 family)
VIDVNLHLLLDQEILCKKGARKMKRGHYLLLIIMILTIGINAMAQYEVKKQPFSEEKKEKPTRLIIRTDDMGFCHACNMAHKKVFEEGVATAVSVMVISPWLDECAAILRDHPEVSVGVHLTLNSEWAEYKWGPVSPVNEVPSLVNAFGKFYGSRGELMRNKPKLDEVEKELRAQIELALRKGLNISYIDYHMGAAVNCLEFQEIVEKLANEYHVGISQYFGETYIEKVYSTPPEGKLAKGIEIMNSLDEPGDFLFVCHPGLDNPEMSAMTDLNVFGLKEMSKHRHAVTDMLCHPDFKAAIKKKGIQLIGYETLKAEGLHLMKRPWTKAPYDEVVEAALPKEAEEE